MKQSKKLSKNLHKSVDSQNGQIRLALSIIHDVQINEFFQLQVISHHALHNLREQNRHIPERKMQNRRREKREKRKKKKEKRKKKKEKRKEKKEKRKKKKDKLSNCHASNNLLNSIDLSVFLATLELSSKFMHLSCIKGVSPKKKGEFKKENRKTDEKRGEGGEGRKKSKIKIIASGMKTKDQRIKNKKE